MLKNIVHGLYDLVYPPNCLICKQYLHSNNHLDFSSFFHAPKYWDRLHLRDILCLHCQSTISPNKPPFCIKCSRFLDKKWDSPKCTGCMSSEIYFDFAWAACLYRDPLPDLIHKFKYYQKTLLTTFFTQHIITFIENYQFDIEQFDFILPIPLCTTRFRERGYNQAALLAQNISHHFHIPFSNNNLIKKQNTTSHALLSKKERWTNIHGAFRIKNPEIFSKKSVLIIDDLLTTGATASEAARVLKEAKAKTVGVLTLAIT